MADSGLYGPLALTANIVDRAVKGVGPGMYALGRTLQGDEFLIERIGRTDYDLNDHIKDHLGGYLEFKFGFFENSAAAFLKECELFHLFKPRDNFFHPDAPDGSNLTCPHCLIPNMRAYIPVGYGNFDIASPRT